MPRHETQAAAAGGAPPAGVLPTGVPLTGVLRARTADLHARVEAEMPVLDPALTLPAYARLLARLLAFHAGAERALGRWAPELRAHGIDLDERRKLPLLQADLRALALRVGAGAGDAAAPADARAAASDTAWHAPAALATTFPRGIGTLYVVEGSTLGGQVIRRRLRATLGVDVDSGGAFFASYGERVGPLWKELRAVVDDWGATRASDADREEAVAGARDAFRAFGHAIAPAARSAA